MVPTVMRHLAVVTPTFNSLSDVPSMLRQLADECATNGTRMVAVVRLSEDRSLGAVVHVYGFGERATASRVSTLLRQGESAMEECAVDDLYP